MPARSIERVGALAAITLHALAGTALLSYEPSRQALFAAVPIKVNLITPPRIEPRPVPPVEVPPPPKPKAIPKRVVKAPEPPPVLTAPVEAPSPSPILVAPPPPEPAPAPSPPPAPAPVVMTPPPVVVTPPIFTADYLENPPPPYPSMSRRLGEQGRVILRVLVDAGGSADEIQVRASSGHARLDNAARDTVRGWRFVPAKRGELPVPAWVLIPISFTLEG